ncbi:MAG: TetR/AcrR family transcriptional regulator [Bacteroidales bacterium]|nr:TetR/AcrR family transcriptional regulator [Bacteroidales bacterium]MCL2132763.1 TetR/AcrR family transcriptional regulator [Bacteroidales bacterium]
MNNTKERIIRESAVLFAKKGCKSITMDDIAGAMGISKRTIYENFSDKKDLLTQSLEYFFQLRENMINNALQSSHNIIEAMFQSTQCHSEFMREIKFDFFNETQKYFPDVYAATIQKFKQESFDSGVKMLKKGQKDGLFREDLDPELIIVLIQTIINMTLTQDIFAPYNYDKALIIHSFMFNYVRGIATEKGLKILDQYLDMYIENTKKLS